VGYNPVAMRVIILGGGEIGFALAQSLAAQHEVFVIDQAPRVADRFEPLDVEFLLGPATSADLLRRAGIDKADVLVACTGLDEVNLVACAIANKLGSPRTFCFVSREEFVGLPQDDKDLAQFGINHIIWPEAQLAADIERIVRAPGAVDAEAFAEGKIQLFEYPLDARSSLIDRPLAELRLPSGALVVAARRGDTFFVPRGESRLAAGDKAVVMGFPDALAEVGRRAQPGEQARRQRVTIVGGGDVGLRLAERLEASASIDLTVIERDLARGEVLAGRLKRALVLRGDGTDLELLESEGIGRSDVLVSVIDNDERNLLTSLLGRQLGAKRILTRVSRPANLRLFERVGIDVAISARGAAVASVRHQIQGGSTRLLALIEQGAGRVLELEVPAAAKSRPLRDLAPQDSIVGAIIRGGTAIVPGGNDRVEPGDRLIVFTTEGAADRVRDTLSGLPG
jgi:trk system potassium uptake protein TrkA